MKAPYYKEGPADTPRGQGENREGKKEGGKEESNTPNPTYSPSTSPVRILFPNWEFDGFFVPNLDGQLRQKLLDLEV